MYVDGFNTGNFIELSAKRLHIQVIFWNRQAILVMQTFQTVIDWEKDKNNERDRQTHRIEVAQ